MSGPARNMAAAIVTGATGAVVAQDGGVTSVARTGPGEYDVVLARPVDPAESILGGALFGAVPGVINLDHTADTTIAIDILDNTGALADIDFSFGVEQRLRGA